MHVLIVGGGIGGVTLGVALQRTGHTVQVLERAATLSPAGAGLVLQPNAMTVLASLDLARRVTSEGCPIACAAFLDRQGRLLGAEVNIASLSAAFGVPALAIHRARLHTVLCDALGASALECGAEVAHVESSASCATLRCSDGRVMNADLIVGADGLRSVARRHVVSDDELVYSGYTSWRGVTLPGVGPRLARMTESWGNGERFGMVDIGHDEIYWFAVVNAKPGGTDVDVRNELLERFDAWHEPVRAVLDATAAERIIRTDISDRHPITRWHRGRVVLLGDAAHPMTPNLGQGACQAIEDASALAEALSAQPSLDAALRQYEAGRVTRANSVVLQARRLGRIAQWQHPVATWLRDTVMRVTPRAVAERQVQSLWRA